jgi:hypothetical protein
MLLAWIRPWTSRYDRAVTGVPGTVLTCAFSRLLANVPLVSFSLICRVLQDDAA